MMVCESWRSLEGRTNAPTRPGSVQRRTNRIRDSGEAVDATLALLPVLLAAIVVCAGEIEFAVGGAGVGRRVVPSCGRAMTTHDG